MSIVLRCLTAEELAFPHMWDVSYQRLLFENVVIVLIDHGRNTMVCHPPWPFYTTLTVSTSTT